MVVEHVLTPAAATGIAWFCYLLSCSAEGIEFVSSASVILVLVLPVVYIDGLRLSNSLKNKINQRDQGYWLESLD
jgi:hypothetical protein